MKTLQSRGITIPLIDEAVEYTNMDVRRLAQALSASEEIPVLDASTNHPYFMMLRFQGPAEMTDAEHPIYAVAGIKFSEPQLVIKMAKPGNVQLGWGHRNPSSDPGVYPAEKVRNLGDKFAGYHVITSPESMFDKGYMVIGEENCRKQLGVWKVSHPSLDALL